MHGANKNCTKHHPQKSREPPPSDGHSGTDDRPRPGDRHIVVAEKYTPSGGDKVDPILLLATGDIFIGKIPGPEDVASDEMTVESIARVQSDSTDKGNTECVHTGSILSFLSRAARPSW